MRIAIGFSNFNLAHKILLFLRYQRTIISDLYICIVYLNSKISNNLWMKKNTNIFSLRHKKTRNETNRKENKRHVFACINMCGIYFFFSRSLLGNR